MTLKVTRVVSGTQDTVIETVPFETRTVDDAELFEGEKKVTDPGNSRRTHPGVQHRGGGRP